MEAAGQLFHLFRDGLDYAFIRLAVEPERGVLFGSRCDPNPSAGSCAQHQPVYESLQGKGS